MPNKQLQRTQERSALLGSLAGARRRWNCARSRRSWFSNKPCAKACSRQRRS